MQETADEGGLRIYLLGSFQIDSGSKPLDLSDWRCKPNSLIKLLALAPGHSLHKE